MFANSDCVKIRVCSQKDLIYRILGFGTYSFRTNPHGEHPNITNLQLEIPIC